MDIKEPAAVFSLEGLKLLIAAIQNNDLEALLPRVEVDEEVENNSEVDRIVKNYFKSTDNELNLVVKILKDFGRPMRVSEISSVLEDSYNIKWNARSSSGKMKKLMKESSNIVKIGYGLYAYAEGDSNNEDNV